MRFHFIAVLVLITFAATITSAESEVQNSYVTSDSNPKVVDDNNARHQVNLKRGRKLTEEGELLVDNEERGVLTSANNLLSRLTARINVKNLAGAKTEKLSGAQIKTVSREVAKEVNKNPKVWPAIKTGLKILFGTVLFGLIAAGVYTMVHQMRDYM